MGGLVSDLCERRWWPGWVLGGGAQWVDLRHACGLEQRWVIWSAEWQVLKGQASLACPLWMEPPASTLV